MSDVDVVHRRVRIAGIVQGVGFRPFVWRRAMRLGLHGHVENDADGVTIELAGPRDAVATFLDGFVAATPPLAKVTGIMVEDLPGPRAEPAGFAILETRYDGSRRAAVIPADIAPCPACVAEMADPHDRRHRHAFISCTDCGPRFTIIDSLPYDRRGTTMRAFPMCPACAAEYRDPSSRRFHAQPIACPTCGPEAWFVARDAAPGPANREAATMRGEAAIDSARSMLRAGGIVAIKGVGGFHLACDAASGDAVAELRRRKRRVRKPFAVMVADLDAARRIAVVDEQEQRLLEGLERPIVLLRRASPAAGGVADAVAPTAGFLGVMLPSSPLHHLLVAGMPPLVMTSGNVAEEPIAIGNDEAFARLGTLADGFLLHDREVGVACDDSVVRCVAGLPLPIRRSRGHAPLPIQLPEDGPPVLAVGGELKATICVARGCEAVLSQHVGDVSNVETLEGLERTAAHLLSLLGVAPALVVADLHPGYFSARWAREFAASRGLAFHRVQHHEAHVASLLTEHGLSLTAAEGTIGICFDGTGHGRDGTIRGGEMYVVRDGGLVRAASLAPFALPGGDAAIRHPWRTALALLREAGVAWDARLPCTKAAGGGLPLLDRQMDRQLNCTPCTSMGRLFDGVASLVGLRHVIDHEAEAALDLESVAASGPWSSRYEAHVVASPAGSLLLDWRPIIRGIAADVLTGVPTATIAAAFHEAVVRLMLEASERLRHEGASGPVGITGGVFQNALLTARCLPSFRASEFDVLAHHQTPPNDGGLALGQAVLGRRQLCFG